MAAKGSLKRGATAVRNAAKKAGKKVKPSVSDLQGPSPNPHTNLAVADIALRSGAFLARRAVEKALLGNKYAPRKAKAILKGRRLGETALHAALARVAMQSVPGAIIVGGGLVAKTLYDRKKAHAAKAEGKVKLEKMADEGSDGGKKF